MSPPPWVRMPKRPMRRNMGPLLVLGLLFTIRAPVRQGADLPSL